MITKLNTPPKNIMLVQFICYISSFF